jgi:PST family polysaccharide transporter
MGKYLLTLLNVGSRAIFSLLMNKWIAVQFGTQGIVFFGQFLNAVAIATATPTDALQRGFIKFQSGKELESKWIQLLLLSHVIAGLIALPVWWSVVNIMPEGSNALSFILIAEAGLIILLLGSAALCIEQAKLAFTKVNLLQISAMALATVTACIASLFLPLPISIALYLFGQGLPIVFVGKLLLQNLSIKNWQLLPWKPLLKFAGSMLVIALLGRITDMWTRTTLLSIYGTHKTGLWQAVQRISELYFVPLTALLNLIFFAKAASLLHEQAALRLYFYKWVGVTIAGSMVILSFIFWWRTELLVLLNTSTFSEASNLMPQQLIGDFFKSVSYIMAMLAIAKGLMKRVIITELCSVVIYVSLVIWQTQTQPFETVSQVHSIRYFAYFMLFAVQLPAILKANNQSIKG